MFLCFLPRHREKSGKVGVPRLDRRRRKRRRILGEQKREVSKGVRWPERFTASTMDEGKSSHCYIRFFRWKVQNRIRVTSLCLGPRGKPTKARLRSRQDLKLLSNDWLGARIEACLCRYLILPRGMLRKRSF